MFRRFAGGKGGSLAGRLFEGTSPPLCGVRTRKSETRRAKSPRNSQAYSGRPGERCSCYGEYKPVWMTCPEKPSTPSFSWPAPDKENPASGGAERGLCSRQLMRGHGLAEASPQYVARYFVPRDSTLFCRHLNTQHACRVYRALPSVPRRQAAFRTPRCWHRFAPALTWVRLVVLARARGAEWTSGPSRTFVRG